MNPLTRLKKIYAANSLTGPGETGNIDVTISGQSGQGRVFTVARSIENWEEEFDQFTDVWKCHPAFKSYILNLLEKQKEKTKIEERARAFGIIHQTILTAKNLVAINFMERTQKEILSDNK